MAFRDFGQIVHFTFKPGVYFLKIVIVFLLLTGWSVAAPFLWAVRRKKAFSVWNMSSKCWLVTVHINSTGRVKIQAFSISIPPEINPMENIVKKLPYTVIFPFAVGVRCNFPWLGSCGVLVSQRSTEFDEIHEDKLREKSPVVYFLEWS